MQITKFPHHIIASPQAAAPTYCRSRAFTHRPHQHINTSITSSNTMQTLRTQINYNHNHITASIQAPTYCRSRKANNHQTTSTNQHKHQHIADHELSLTDHINTSTQAPTYCRSRAFTHRPHQHINTSTNTMQITGVHLDHIITLIQAGPNSQQANN